MTFSQLRTQVDALCRRFAAELEVYRLRPLALAFCDEMTNAVTGAEPSPQLSLLELTQVLLSRMTGRGFRPRNLLALYDYLERCLNRRVLPQANDVLRSLLPKAARRGLIPRSPPARPFLDHETRAARRFLQRPRPGDQT